MNQIFVIDKVVEVIEKAFAPIPYPGDDNIAFHQEYEPSDGWRCAQVLRGRRWQDVPPGMLMSCATSFLTPEAYCYYLPTYMLARLQHREEADVAGDFIVYSLEPPTEEQQSASWLEKMNRLSTTQKRAVRMFLEAVVHDAADIQDNAQVALDEYWGKF